MIYLYKSITDHSSCNNNSIHGQQNVVLAFIIKMSVETNDMCMNDRTTTGGASYFGYTLPEYYSCPHVKGMWFATDQQHLKQ